MQRHSRLLTPCLASLAALGMLAAASGCSARLPGDRGGAPSPSFSRDVLPLLQSKFAPLLAEEKGLRLDSWRDVLTGSDYGQVLIPYDPDHSLVIRLADRARTSGEPAGRDALPTEHEIGLARDWIASGAPNDEGAIPYANAENLLYVCNQDAALISIVDMEANVVIRTIDLTALGFDAMARPHHVAVEPDGSFWYVSLIGAGRVLKFDRANRLVGSAVFETPGMLAIHPTEDVLMVGRSMMAVSPPQRIGRIRRSDMAVEEVDVFIPRPHGIAVAPDGRHIYTASLAQDRLAIVEEDGGDVSLVDLQDGPHTLVQLAISPDGSRMVAGGQLSGVLLVFDLKEPAQPSVLASIPVGSAPWHPVFSPDGRWVYVGSKQADAVSVVDMEALRVAAVVEGSGISQPHGSAVSSDGHTLYISNNNLNGRYRPRYPLGPNEKTGTLVAIDTEHRTIVKVLELSAYPSGIGTR